MFRITIKKIIRYWERNKNDVYINNNNNNNKFKISVLKKLRETCKNSICLDVLG